MSRHQKILIERPEDRPMVDGNGSEQGVHGGQSKTSPSTAPHEIRRLKINVPVGLQIMVLEHAVLDLWDEIFRLNSLKHFLKHDPAGCRFFDHALDPEPKLRSGMPEKFDPNRGIN